MKLALKWAISLAIGAFFIWLSARSWPLHEVFDYEFRIEGSYLVAGDTGPGCTDWYPAGEERPRPAGCGVDASAGGPGLAATEEASPPTLSANGGGARQRRGWSFNLLYILPYGAILVLIHFLRVIRWYPLLRPITKVGFWKLNRVGAVGFMSVFILPLRLGEFARPLLIAERGKIRMSEAMATIVVERVVDGLMTSLLLFIVLRFLPTGDMESYAELRAGSYIALAVFLSGITILGLMYWRRDWTVRMIRRFVGRVVPGIAERIISILEAFLRGLSVLPDWRNIAAFVGITALYWGINGVGLYIFCRGFGLHIPLLAGYAMMASVVIGMMIPNSPANVGSFWFFLLKPLQLYGLGGHQIQAIAAALGIWAMQLLQLLVFGCYHLLRGKVSVKDVWSRTTRGESRTEELADEEPPTAARVESV